VVGEFGNSTEKGSTGWPDRIYLIDQNGRVAFKNGTGPFGFKAEELAAALRKLENRPPHRTLSGSRGKSQAPSAQFLNVFPVFSVY
jgi:hypothetical protein